MWPIAPVLHVLLVWYLPHLKPCVQQYLSVGRVGLNVLDLGVVELVLMVLEEMVDMSGSEPV